MNFTVNGKPFFPVGGQSHNSSAYDAEEIASAIAGVCALGGNMLEAPVYWEQIEPEEGLYDFASVDTLHKACDDAGLKLVVLWFGTWKNGEMRYVPEWVKQDRTRFPRVVGYDGNRMNVLSSYSVQTRDADTRAFVELCRHIERVEGEEQTVVAVQVENEPGILGSDRDYGEAAAAAVREQVPSSLLEYLRGRSTGPVYDCWQMHGALVGQDWLDTFGFNGYEYREAWSIAVFIDSIAVAGHEHLNVPMYTNVWLGGDGWQVPGFYPAGGPVAAVLDIWKAGAPHLATIAPDIYITNPERFRGTCASFARDDNPLFVPESGANDNNAMNMLTAIAEYDAIGYACFAVDSVLDLEGNLRPEAQLYAGSFACVTAMLPLIQRFRGTGKIRAVIQQEAAAFYPLRFERFNGMIPYGAMGYLGNVTDHRHGRMAGARESKPCFGLIVETGPYEFYLAGQFHLHLVPNQPPGWTGALRFPTVATPPDYLSVEEGVLLDDGSFEPRRRRNGDEVVFGGFWAAPDVGVVRVRLSPR
jgi:hypothetical protein